MAKAVGPDNIPSKMLKDFAPEQAPTTRDIYNHSFKEGYFPSLPKSFFVTAMPKVTPPRTSNRDLKPTSLTCTLAKVMEGFCL